MHQQTDWEPTYITILKFLGRNLPIVSFLFLSLAGMLFVYWFFSPPTDSTAQAIALNTNLSFSAPIYKAVPDRPVGQRFKQSPGPIRIGIIAGHSGNDSGAVCDDGLTEADVNANIATMVAERLASQGVAVDILEEFDPRLVNYPGTAVVSIHADSCAFINDDLSGFKIASTSFNDATALFTCVEQSYQANTQLRYHANTITAHMTDYHVFRTLPTSVPAIILEVGFLNLDRELLTTNAHIPAQGISEGILCYLDKVR